MEPGYPDDANELGRGAMNAVCLVTAESNSSPGCSWSGLKDHV